MVHEEVPKKQKVKMGFYHYHGFGYNYRHQMFGQKHRTRPIKVYLAFARNKSNDYNHVYILQMLFNLSFMPITFNY